MIYLTKEEIVMVNHQVLIRTGQKYMGIQYPEGLSVIVEQPQMKVFNNELYPSIWLKAAYIVQKITKKHIFIDGNKRTAYLCLLLFLKKNSWELHLSADEGEAFIVQITLADDSEEEMIAIAYFLEKHCVKA
ncbi:type II toxin-antitoxin system death-on-curing family toxin [Limosilactobacillus agrestis]|uniref:Type II toxin-antitoxin system death-on-curing family toxin n=1 Tax=Limosilactobacillus agrestis TaxID=2759748 RepID=A0A7W3YKQ3_9LACO|nr:type II toxin-antitoxin system death-on-curing family toxin [Limosilactobacillus agrestis]MBD5090900.1 type II toxin-antitoxin system death-on-curing family toxin [Lactobacillus sp.]MBB1095519.1 type II toxin-antitoxin system death-on-curing family toxin [Limosilactobacillus agrestis]MBB1098771.1 type II toxin-antitoxin system death-on-curing family toxin [Limosilactobacillus agrestis]MCD7120044.1 type II toxin-antitoxin system death-on-curing family toxin [Limosilactobacillus agrestis]MCD7